MKFYKNNAYPDINLHDCNFKLIVEDNCIKFNFSEGFGMLRDGKYESIKGMIKISDISIDDLDMREVKMFNFLGVHKMISKWLSIKELNRIFESGYLQVYAEYYSFNAFMWECAIFYPNNKKAKLKRGWIEIRGFMDSPMEYYIEEQEN